MLLQKFVDGYYDAIKQHTNFLHTYYAPDAVVHRPYLKGNPYFVYDQNSKYAIINKFSAKNVNTTILMAVQMEYEEDIIVTVHGHFDNSVQHTTDFWVQNFILRQFGDKVLIVSDSFEFFENHLVEPKVLENVSKKKPAQAVKSPQQPAQAPHKAQAAPKAPSVPAPATTQAPAAAKAKKAKNSKKTMDGNPYGPWSPGSAKSPSPKEFGAWKPEQKSKLRKDFVFYPPEGKPAAKETTAQQSPPQQAPPQQSPPQQAPVKETSAPEAPAQNNPAQEATQDVPSQEQ